MKASVAVLLLLCVGCGDDRLPPGMAVTFYDREKTETVLCKPKRYPANYTEVHGLELVRTGDEMTVLADPAPDQSDSLWKERMVEVRIESGAYRGLIGTMPRPNLIPFKRR